MIKSNQQIFLASKSPRRRKLLKQIGLKFKSFQVDLYEEIFDGEHPVQTVKRLSLHKMEEAAKKVSDAIIITADTIVVLDHEIIGKPKNEEDAFKILTKLSGRTHEVFTGFAILNQKTKNRVVSYEKTKVTFRTLSKKEISDYVKTGSPMDKAGAYGIQDDFGSVFVEKINGCYYNVTGLPIQKLYKELLKIV